MNIKFAAKLRKMIELSIKKIIFAQKNNHYVFRKSL